MVQLLPNSYARVLEVGCAAGGFYDYLKQPCEVWGIEPNTEAAKAASLKMHRVLTGSSGSVASHLPDHYFDLVVEVQRFWNPGQDSSEIVHRKESAPNTARARVPDREIFRYRQHPYQRNQQGHE
jgi:hypothetical protein